MKKSTNYAEPGDADVLYFVPEHQNCAISIAAPPDDPKFVSFVGYDASDKFFML